MYFLFLSIPSNAQVPQGYFTWDNATVYFLLNDRFNNGNPANDTNYGRTADPVAGFLGGDLAGITQKINDGYFDDLGVNAIWLTPPYDQIQADGCTCAGFTDFTVYFKKPPAWVTPVKIHYWDRQPSNTATDWPGVDMAVCGNGWWSYTFSATSSTNLLFHDDNGNQTADLFRNSEGWYDGGWGSAGSCGQGGVSVSPATPSPDEIVTVTFDATGSDLEGAAKVYFHSGVSVTVNDVTSFDYSLGNWGQDDGIGEMTNMGGNNWQFVITPSLRIFYTVAVTDDLFGMNFLFRSADGSLKEDNNGANYFNPVSTGAYFTITSPSISPYLVPVNSSFNLTSEANTTPTSWTLEEVDINGNTLSTLGTQAGGISYTESINLVTTTTH